MTVCSQTSFNKKAGDRSAIQNLSLHRKLVNGFFRNASHMLQPYGEVHVSHKMVFPFCQWNLEELASNNSLMLSERVEFKIEDYPGYINKRGDGHKCDQPFPLGECSTYKFMIVKPPKRKAVVSNAAHFCGRSSSAVISKWSLGGVSAIVRNDSFVGNDHFQNGYSGNVNIRSQIEYPISAVSSSPSFCNQSTVVISSLLRKLFEYYLVDSCSMFGGITPEFNDAVQRSLRNSLQAYMDEAPGRTVYGYIALLEELHRSTVLRSVWLQWMMHRLSSP